MNGLPPPAPTKEQTPTPWKGLVTDCIWNSSSEVTRTATKRPRFQSTTASKEKVDWRLTPILENTSQRPGVRIGRRLLGSPVSVDRPPATSRSTKGWHDWSSAAPFNGPNDDARGRPLPQPRIWGVHPDCSGSEIADTPNCAGPSFDADLSNRDTQRSELMFVNTYLHRRRGDVHVRRSGAAHAHRALIRTQRIDDTIGWRKGRRPVSAAKWCTSSKTRRGAVYRPEDGDIPLSRRPRERLELFRTDGRGVHGEATTVRGPRATWPRERRRRLDPHARRARTAHIDRAPGASSSRSAAGRSR